MGVLTIAYSFMFPDEGRLEFKVQLDEDTLAPVDPLPDELPEWTRLEYHQCSNCPLKPETDPRCPLAARLYPLIDRFKGHISYETLRVEVKTHERTVIRETDAQQAVSSLMGLVIATSGCPRAEPFKPMARFHLPLSSAQETVYRAASMYALAQILIHQKNGRADFELAGLLELYTQMEVLNGFMADRIRHAMAGEVTLNALVLLDFFAKSIFFEFEDHLEHIKRWFQIYLKDLTPEG